MLDKIGKIITPFIFGYGIGYIERNYTWNKAWDNNIKNINQILKDIIID